ncbi:carbohydrate kinase family protein [Roseitranquillus sediminis]|uniref:carbohydrate kinase family protein n=1 Tax=Roseitranquillus sediminis TaxID=2809051 RepID=UPI001D0C9DB5|nr:carbohydrate kinase [Roseitranquillus sediminis]MBM9594789.1 carbohydrate kinase [Roseitranquillus sediminis]
MILCCGEALIDMLPRRTEAGALAYAPHVGGAVFNTAIALGRLDVATGFFTGLSTDMFGLRLERALAESGVDTALSHRSDRPTTLAFVELTQGQARYVFYDEGTAGRMLAGDELPALPDEIKALFFGGISLVAEPCGTAYEALMAKAAASRVTMIDPNVRPGFIRDEAAYRGRIGRMMALADIVKLSDEDLHWLEGPGDAVALAGDILKRGPHLVCITEGARGATGYTAAGAVHVDAPRVTVADTVGAGDTFNAGLLAGLARGGVLRRDALRQLDEAALRDALDLGVRAAAITVSREGANPPRASEL